MLIRCFTQYFCGHQIADVYDIMVSNDIAASKQDILAGGKGHYKDSAFLYRIIPLLCLAKTRALLLPKSSGLSFKQ